MWHQPARFEKKLTSILSNLNNFRSLEVVDRVSETTSRGWKFKLNNLAVKELKQKENKCYRFPGLGAWKENKQTTLEL